MEDRVEKKSQHGVEDFLLPERKLKVDDWKQF